MANETKAAIYNLIQNRKSISGADISRILGISRQAVNKHIQQLFQQGLIIKEGHTKSSKYKTNNRQKAWSKQWRQSKTLAGLDEDRVFEEAALFLNLSKNIKPNVQAILNYAFTEMVNNAVDHSGSGKCDLTFKTDNYNCIFSVRDFGIGIFHSIYKKYSLPDEYTAISELIKGKATTMPERHTGEGIFFTSKCADHMLIRSHRIQVVYANDKQDTFAETKRYIKGTLVEFRVKRDTHRKLEGIFNEFASETHDYNFDKTKIMIRLLPRDYLSRSEAKRLLYRLERFKEVILDFKGVTSIGQGFADEIFRVFKASHPDIIITTANTTPVIEQIIKHVSGGGRNP